MSIHSAKGLEFPIVVVGAIDAGRSDRENIACARVNDSPLLGVRVRIDDDWAETVSYRQIRERQERLAQEEAKRLLYVACTRAERGLIVVALSALGKDADGRLSGLLRKALGCGAAGSASEGTHVLGQGRSTVRIALPSPRQAPGAREAAPEECVDLPPLPPLPERTSDASGVPARISYSALATYEQCAYKYYARSVARLRPRAQTGTGGTDPLAFGSAVHQALEECLAPAGVSGERLSAIAHAAALTPSETERLASAVGAFLSSEAAAAAFASERVLREVPIAVPVAGTVLTGAIDLIAWNGRTALIVDYKTGDRPLSDEAALERYALQGRCYALAALAAGAEHVDVVFSELERGRETRYAYDIADEGALASAIGSLVSGMAQGRYHPLDAYDRHVCGDCPALGGICPIDGPLDGAAG